ncbi:ATP-dependent DNA ligase [Podospora aff. communis PSN243]|uniref:DNA ligase n=1 Tax=Podospora aff. communis PSN243 TaxID=3040156 RepID=A0AAV9G5P2_9PEZI|nr:ATP-dependent DNA ligase [Podospora aff. communis PSN243]
MASPAKKRKLNSDSKSTIPSKGLEYFFAKQRQNAAPSEPKSSGSASSSNDAKPAGEDLGSIADTLGLATEASHLTDEELARKLQAEWNAESSIVSIQNGGPDGDASSRLKRETPSSPAPKQASTSLPFQPAAAKNTLSLSSVAATEDPASASLPLDESPLTFDPSKYIPQLQESWSADGGDASYALLTRCFVLVSSTQSRIKIVDTLVNCIRVLIEADPSSLLPAVWLATNAISPPYISMELGLGGSAISKALKQVCGLDNRSLKAIYDRLGDPGDVAFEAKKKQSFTLRKPKPLTIKGVFQSLVKIAKTQGQGSGDVKQRIVDKLLQDARGGEESRYIVRTLCQHLRIGAVKTTMLIALSRAFLLSKPAGAEFPTRDRGELAKLKKEEHAEVWAKPEEIVKACFARHPDYNDLVPALLEIGVCEELLVRCGLTLHIPLRPMLGSITRDLSEMLTKLQDRDFACEYKYDGQRAQIHCDAAGKVTIFSRHLELMTDKYPDLVALVPKIRGEGVQSFIMEGEVVAVDRSTGELKNFQTLTNRARKDVAIGSITIDVCMFAFDLMYLNGQPLLDRSFRERRDMLRSLFVEILHHFTWVKSLDATSQDSETVLEFFKSAIDAKCEGIMVKILDNLPEMEYRGNKAVDEAPELADDKPPPAKKAKKGKAKATEGDAPEKKSRRKALLATYEPDKRLDSWLKVKKDYNSSFETLDLIPVAGWHGQGRKAKWWSPILMAVRNEETGMLEAVCKCMSGFTDTFYKANKEFYDDGSESGQPQNIHAQKPSFIEYAGHPDVWFEPQEVWEMAFADITISPTYTAAIGLVQEDKGLSLRFPRFIKKREDKGIDEASTNEFLASLWEKQEAKAPAKGGAEDGAVDEEELI